MSALPPQVWRRPFIKDILRNLFEGPSSYSGRCNTAKRFFSAALLLDDTPSNLASRLAQRQGHPPTPVDDSIFENESEEYILDYAASPPSLLIPTPPLSTLQHVVHPLAEYLQLQLQQVDRTLFETVSEEYLETTEGPLWVTESPKKRYRGFWSGSHRVMKRATGLKSLVVRGDFARAESLREELFEAGVQIKRDVKYADAALHAWKTKPVQERAERFYEWFSLVPHASLGRIRRTRIALHHVKQTLFSEPSDLNTIACFGLVAARKGLANYVAIHVMAHIARFASPGVSSAFLDEMELAAKRFYWRFHNHTKDSSTFSLWDAVKWHNMYIRALCFAGYIDAVVDRTSHVLRNRRDIPVAPFTWTVLLEVLTESGRRDLLGAVRELRATVVKDKQKTFDADDRLDQDILKQSTIHGPRPDDNNTPTLTGDSPSAGYLAGMMNHYIKSGDIEDLRYLRQEMMGSGAQPDLWVTAQMKFYLDRGQYIVILRQFMQYYSCIGVPKDLVLPYVREGSLWLNGKADKAHASLPIIYSSASAPSPGIDRWPSTHIITMVWQSMVSLADDKQTIQALYRSFLRYWDRHRPSTSSERPPGSSKKFLANIRFQYPPVMGPDTVHFQVFIVAFARVAGAEAAMQVLADMQARGIRPDVHNWTALAGHFAGQDEFKSAEKILRRMETSLDEGQLARASSSVSANKIRTVTGPMSRPAGWVPGPNIVTYTTILRGLVDCGRIEEAKKFEERMRRAGYIRGRYERTDSVFEILRSRERSHRVSWDSRAG